MNENSFLPKIEQVDRERKHFCEQFAHIEQIPFGESSFEAWDIKPLEQTKETPVIFIPGWGKTPRSYEDTLYEFVKAGRRVITLSMPTQDTQLDEVHTSVYPTAQANRADAILTLLAAKGLGEADVIAHSEGCINLAIAAERSPQVFRHFVLISPPDLTEKESRFGIMRQAGKNTQIAKEEMKAMEKKIKEGQASELEKAQYGTEKTRYQQGEKDTKLWLKKRGLIKGLWESMNSIVTRHVWQNMKSKGEHGISIVSGADDEMVSMKKLQTKNAEGLGVDGFYSVAGGHDRIAIRPEQYSYLAEQALSALEKKYSTVNTRL